MRRSDAVSFAFDSLYFNPNSRNSQPVSCTLLDETHIGEKINLISNEVLSEWRTTSSTPCVNGVVFRCRLWLFFARCPPTWPAACSWFWKVTFPCRSGTCQIVSITGICKSVCISPVTWITQEPKPSLCHGGGYVAHLPVLAFSFGDSCLSSHCY